MEDLAQLGFARAGGWRLDPTLRSGVRCELVGEIASQRAVYSFVVGGRVMYVGICERDCTTLRDRMRRYQSLAGGSTNERIAGLIRDTLQAGSSVEVWALLPPELSPSHGSVE